MGSKDCGDSAKPVHTVYLDKYYIGKYEVTNAQYKKFCEATRYSQPEDPGFSGMPDYFTSCPNYPVVGVDWNDVQFYCKWAGLRLPTEAEWEKAARGTDGRKYPWGNKWDGNKCNHGTISRKRLNTNIGGTPLFATMSFGPDASDGYEYSSPVDSFPSGVSPYGAYDMAGNVLQWCNDWYAPDYYKSSPDSNPTGPSSGLTCVVRGSYWSIDKGDWYFYSAFRSRNYPETKANSIGFRLAK